MADDGMDADVLVLGAGLAGLTAARDLHAAGRRVIVLEARDRLGGRTWSGILPGTDVPVEWGGTWIVPDAQPAVAREVARYGLPLSPTPDPTVMVRYLDGRLQHDAAADAVLDQATDEIDVAIRAIRARLDGAGDATDLTALADVDVAVTDWVAAQDLSPAARDSFLAFAAAMGGGDPARLGILPLVLDAVQNDYRIQPTWHDIGWTFSDGTAARGGALAAGLDVRQRHGVRAVGEDADGAAVEVDGGLTIRARAVVVAIPLNVWRTVRFVSGLGAAKAGAAATGQPGHSSKVLAVARGVPAGFGAVGWGVPLQALVATRSVEADTQLLTGFAGRGRVDANDRGAVEAAVHAFIPEAEVVAHAGHDWSADPFSLGTWCALPPGWLTDGTFAALEVPEGRLAFAGGDIAPDGAGWIEGAVASGGRAATSAAAILGSLVAG